jgi:hypothetical protein
VGDKANLVAKAKAADHTSSNVGGILKVA